MKVVLALQHEEIPPNLHFKQPNPLMAWENLPLQVPTSLKIWSRGETPRIAGVSSFGMSGTNAHVVLEEAPISVINEKDSVIKKERPFHLLTLSAKSDEALRELAQAYETYLKSHPTLSIADVCFMANTGRSHFTHRLAVVADSPEQLQEQLGAFAVGEKTVGLVSGQRSKPPKIAFLFTGQGSQYVGMGRELYETQPPFRQTLERCDEILRPYLEKPLLEVLYQESDIQEERKILSSPTRHFSLNETAYTQPALFALEYALVKLWQSWGIEPTIVMGHSVGEYVAACVAGVFSLEEGLKLIAERARLMQSLPVEGEMLTVLTDEARVATACQPYSQDISIAAINEPNQIVISGRHDAIQAVRESLETEGIMTHPLSVSQGSHSPLMKPMLADFKRFASTLNYSVPQLDIISNVTGKLIQDEIATPEYWCRHTYQPVRFVDGMKTLHQQDIDVFVEIGPKPTLLGMGRQCLPSDVGIWLPSLRQWQSNWQQLLWSLGELYVQGGPMDWLSFDRDYSRRRLQLPTYPWQRQRYWIDTMTTGSAASAAFVHNRQTHPLLGHQLNLAGTQDIRFEGLLSQQSHPYLTHHRVDQLVILPGSAYLEMGLAAAGVSISDAPLLIKDVTIEQPLILPEEKTVTVQLLLSKQEKYRFQIFSLPSPDAEWIRHATGEIEPKDFEDSKQPLNTMGFDSLIAVELRDRLINDRRHTNGQIYGRCQCS